jgi:hypothetical protein
MHPNRRDYICSSSAGQSSTALIKNLHCLLKFWSLEFVHCNFGISDNLRGLIVPPVCNFKIKGKWSENICVSTSMDFIKSIKFRGKQHRSFTDEPDEPIKSNAIFNHLYILLNYHYLSNVHLKRVAFTKSLPWEQI